MDFVFDADTYVSSIGENESKKNEPSFQLPSTPIKLPSFPFQGDLKERISSFNIIKSINRGLKGDNKEDKSTDIDSPNQQEEVESSDSSVPVASSNKYVNNCLHLLANDPYMTSSQSSNDPEKIQTEILGSELNRVLNRNTYDTTLRRSLGLLQDQLANQKSAISGDKNVSYSTLASSGPSGVVARRKLRDRVEEDILKKHYLALREFQPIVEKLEYLKGDLDNLNECFNGINTKLNDTISSSSDVRKTLSAEVKQRDITRAKRSLLSSFKTNFTLNQYEQHYLINGEIDDEYFKVLDRVHEIVANCDILLGMNRDKLGVAIMNQMNQNVNVATDKMAGFLKKSFNMASQQSSASRDKNTISNLQRSLIYIKKNSVAKFNTIVSELITDQSRLLIEDFTNQLKGYSESARITYPHNKKTLLMSSYDTKRFVSDVLAYVHSVIVNELELVESLFNFDQAEVENQGLIPVIKSVGNKIVDALSLQMKGAIETSFRQESNATVIVDIYELLDLYCMMYGKLVNKETSELIKTLSQLKQETKGRLLNIIQLKVKACKAESELEDIGEDFLGLPDWFVEFYSKLLHIFDHDTNDKSTGFMGMNDTEMKQLTEVLLDEPITLLDEESKRLDLTKRSKMIFKINCLDFLNSKIEVFPRLKDNKGKEVTDRLNSLIEKLSQSQFDDLLKKSGLYDVYNLINMIFSLEDDFFDVSVYQPITENKLFNEATFKEADKRLESFLASYITSDELNKLISPSIISKVSTEPAIKFVKFYQKLSMIVQEYLRDDKGQTIPVFKWDSSHIATLLGVEVPDTTNDQMSDV